MALLLITALFGLQCAGHTWVQGLFAVQGGMVVGLPGFARNNGSSRSHLMELR
jgi:hypothetical protein